MAVSPQSPDRTQASLLHNFLDYEVLSDLGNQVARHYRLVVPVTEPFRKLYRQFGVDLAVENADDSWELPLPGTFVIDREGIVRLAFVDADHTKRLEPAAIIACLERLAQH